PGSMPCATLPGTPAEQRVAEHPWEVTEGPASEVRAHRSNWSNKDWLPQCEPGLAAHRWVVASNPATWSYRVRFRVKPTREICGRAKREWIVWFAPARHHFA